MEKIKFPYDPINRIQKLFYDYDFDDLPTIYNKNKLLKTKTKFIKYFHYCMKHVENVLTPQINELDKKYADLTQELDEQESKIDNLIRSSNKTPRCHHIRHITHLMRWCDIDYTKKKLKLTNNRLNVIKERNDVRRHNQTVSLERECTHCSCKTIGLKIDYMVAQIRRIRKNYKKCNHCEKTDMLTICGCKSKHKLCSDCNYNKTECPVCKEDLGLVYCAICMEIKKIKEIEKTGCKNKHQTCKECLVKIKEKNNKCPFCREDLGPTNIITQLAEIGYEFYAPEPIIVVSDTMPNWVPPEDDGLGWVWGALGYGTTMGWIRG